MKIVLLLVSLVLSNVALAWDGITPGTISRIDVAAGDSQGFRVYLDGSPTLCGNSATWGYLNENDSNYQTFVGTLLSAKVTQSNVTIYANLQSNSYCKIEYVVLN